MLSLQLVKTAYLDPSQNYLAGFHPHGVLATGAFTNLCTESTGFSSLFPGIRPHLMMLNLWFWTPFFRDYVMSGGLVPVDKESAAHILSREGGGNLMAIIVGGVQEALDARPGGYKLVLRNRKGFIRLALMHGYWEEGSGFNWRLARIVFWWEDSTDEYTSYFGRESLNPLTVKILCW